MRALDLARFSQIIPRSFRKTKLDSHGGVRLD